MTQLYAPLLILMMALTTTFTLLEMMVDEAIDFSKTGKRSTGLFFIITLKKLVVTFLWCYFLYLLKTT